MKCPQLVFSAVLFCFAFVSTALFGADEKLPAVSEKVRILPEVRNGFIHPGLELSKKDLENVRKQILAGREPWMSYWRNLCRDSRAGRNVVPRNESRQNPSMPDSDAWDNAGMQGRLWMDGDIAYKQALMYFFTGDNVYRRNALRSIRVWGKLDPKKFRYYSGSHIHAGPPFHYMLLGAEIIRHTSTDDPELVWTDSDTKALEHNLIRPAIENFMNHNGWFMNQNNFALMGALTGFIFIDDREGYDQRVEWFTVNRTAPDQGINGSIKQLARLATQDDSTGERVEPQVQLTEMGRDQAHSAEDMNLFALSARMLKNQKTRVDPASGVRSTAPDAVPAIEFRDHSILRAADYFCRFMMGYDTPWTTIACSYDKQGNARDFYRMPSENYKGRWTTFEFWSIWLYYTYEKGWDLSKIAPYFDRAYRLRINPGNWLFLPPEAEGPSLRYVPQDQRLDEIPLAGRTTPLDEKFEVVKEDGRRILRIKPDPVGARVAILSCATPSRRVAFRVRTNAAVEARITDFSRSLKLPNTRGEWRCVFYSIRDLEYLDNCHYATFFGKAGSVADVDAYIPEADKILRPPVLEEAEKTVELIAWAGAPLKFQLHRGEGAKAEFRLWGAPEGVTISPSGEIQIRSERKGTIRFFAGLDDGKSIVACEVIATIGADRNDALRLALNALVPGRTYRRASMRRFQRTRAAAEQACRESESDEQVLQRLQELFDAAREAEPLTPRLADGSIDYRRIAKTDVGTEVYMLTDEKKSSAPQFFWGTDLNYCFDFGPNYRVSLDSVMMLGWLIFDNRMADSTVFASNDMQKWDRITPEATPLTEEPVTLEVAPEFRNRWYRYVKFAKLHRRSSGIFTVAELRLYGRRMQINESIESVSISSPDALCNRIQPGAVVRLEATVCEPIRNLRATIAGVPAKIRKTESGFVAQAVAPRGGKTGDLTFAIDYDEANGKAAPTVDWTTDGTTLFFSDDSHEIRDVLERARLIDTTPKRSAAETRKFASSLFDGDQNTYPDFRSERGGGHSGIAFDFGKRPVAVSRIEFLPIKGRNAARIAGMKLQGSNDGETWTDLTKPAAYQEGWQTVETARPVKTFRFYRIFNENDWFGNVSELRLHAEP